MFFGMPNLVECRDIYECIDTASKHKLNFVEINTSFPNYRPDTLNVDKLSALAKERGIFYTIHADEELNPFDFNPKVSKCYFDVLSCLLGYAILEWYIC